MKYFSYGLESRKTTSYIVKIRLSFSKSLATLKINVKMLSQAVFWTSDVNVLGGFIFAGISTPIKGAGQI